MAYQHERDQELREIEIAFFDCFCKFSKDSMSRLVSILDIGRELGLSVDAAKCSALKLEDEGLIAYKQPEGRYSLTSKGLAKAMNIRREVTGARVFICYSHQDRKFLDRLLVHLKPLARTGVLDVWHDQRIPAGAEWRKEIRAALEAARVAVLMISPDFFSSDFIVDDELPPLIEAARLRGTVILPLILSPSAYERSPVLGKLQAFNPLSKPLSVMRKVERDNVLNELAKAIANLVSTKEVPEDSSEGSGPIHPPKP